MLIQDRRPWWSCGKDAEESRPRASTLTNLGDAECLVEEVRRGDDRPGKDNLGTCEVMDLVDEYPAEELSLLARADNTRYAVDGRRSAITLAA